MAWHQAVKALVAALPATASGSHRPVSEEVLEALRTRADALLETEAQVFERDLSKRNSSDARWLQQVKRSGTTSDKIAATTLLVQVRVCTGLDGIAQRRVLPAHLCQQQQMPCSARQAGRMHARTWHCIARLSVTGGEPPWR